MKNMKLYVAFIYAFCAVAAAVTLSCGSDATVKNVKPENKPLTVITPDPNATPPPDTMAAGKKLYEANCAACHKEDGAGGKMVFEGRSIDPDDLTTEKIKAFPDDKIYNYIYKGIPDEGMPAFKDKLSEAEIREVVRYIRIGLQKIPESDTIKLQPQKSPEAPAAK